MLEIIFSRVIPQVLFYASLVMGGICIVIGIIIFIREMRRKDSSTKFFPYPRLRKLSMVVFICAMFVLATSISLNKTTFVYGLSPVILGCIYIFYSEKSYHKKRQP